MTKKFVEELIKGCKEYRDTAETEIEEYEGGATCKIKKDGRLRASIVAISDPEKIEVKLNPLEHPNSKTNLVGEENRELHVEKNFEAMEVRKVGEGYDSVKIWV